MTFYCHKAHQNMQPVRAGGAQKQVVQLARYLQIQTSMINSSFNKHLN